MTADKPLALNFSAFDTLYIYTRIGSPTSHIQYQVVDKNNKVIGETPLKLKKYYIARNDHSPDNFDYVLNWRSKIDKAAPQQ